jgi:ABC-type sugar transport system ATPase subunit
VNRFVASFIGSPSMNLFETTLVRGRFQLGTETIDTGLEFSGPADIGIRPETIRLNGAIRAAVAWTENLGLNTLTGLRIGPLVLAALVPERLAGESAGISIEAKDVYVFDKASGANISHARGRGALRS